MGLLYKHISPESEETMKYIREFWSRELIRPSIYKLFRRLVYAFTLVLLGHFFFGKSNANFRSTGFALAALVMLLGALCAYLRLDGLRIPHLPSLRKRSKRRDVLRVESMSDHVDDIPEYTDADLDEDETNVSILLADLCAALLLALTSFLF